MFQDFEKYGVFNAQEALEKVHKEEEDVLYTEIFEDRKQQVHTLLFRYVLFIHSFIVSDTTVP